MRAIEEQAATELDADALLRLYRSMVLIRLTEEELARCHQRGLIHGACHTYVGQEAIAAGVCAHLTAADSVFSTHRGHGHALAKGMPPGELMAELFGRVTGCSRGRGGSMHLFAPEIGMLGTSGIVGPCILQACGGGYAAQLMRTGTVAVAFFGDGAVNNGAFHEGLNMAAIWKLPVLFICENNEFATEVPFAYSSGTSHVGRRAENYGIAGMEIDGNDALAVHAAAGEAVERARSGAGPTLIECRTYRTRPHAEGMGDFTYRTKEQVQAWKLRCPIVRLRERLIEEFQIAASALETIDSEIEAIVAQSRKFAEESPWPDPATADSHVYAPITSEPSSSDPRPTILTAEGKSERRITYSQATLEALSAEMAANPKIFVLGEGVGERGGNFRTTAGLYAEFGAERLRDTPICERGFVGLACGAAMAGTRPIVDFMFADFVLDGLGEIINQIAKMQYMSSGRLKMPVLLRGCIGIGHSAATHHSGSYYNLYAQIPGLRVVAPSNPYDAKGLLIRALRCDDPVVFLEHRELLQVTGDVPEESYEIPFGQAAVVRPGTDLTIVAFARMVHESAQAAEELARGGHSVEVIDLRTLLPLDIATVAASVRKTGRLLIVDESPGACGYSAEVAAQIVADSFDDLDAPIRRLTGIFTPTPYSPALEAAIVPSASQIVSAARQLLEE